MNKIEKALDLIYNNNELKEKLIKLETLEEVYEFCASISGGYTREEFENFIAEMCKAAQGNFQEFGLPISDKDAEKISGGIQLKFSNSKSLASLLAMLTATSPMAYGVNATNLSSKHGEVGSEEAEEIEVDETDAESEEADAGEATNVESEETDAVEDDADGEEKAEDAVEEPAGDNNDIENDDSKNTDEEKDAEQEVDKSSNHTSLKAGGIIAAILGAIGIKKWYSRSNSEEPNKPKDQNLDQKKVEDKSNTNVKNGRENVDLLGDNVTENLEQLRSKSHKSIYVHEKFPKGYSNLLDNRSTYNLPSIFGVGYNLDGTYDEKNIPQLIQEKLVIENKILPDFQSFCKDNNFFGTSDDRLSGYIRRFVGTRKREIESLSKFSNMYSNNWKCFVWESCVILIVTCDVLNEVFEKRPDFNAPTIKNKLNELNNLRKELSLEKYYAKSVDKDGKIEIAEG